ncbi:MAG TPA: isoprenylcysteine carboxylmethyltransferase family protein, partial [Terriglobia bacterium]|nr:isoprenylcysteine carboxylmethyltransferase family protein [Terriglobia bacterium]
DAGRFHWSGSIPWVITFDALIVFVLASAIQNWAISANPFFSSTIRIQSERGHRVMTSGPYRFVRHPGYLAMAISMPATALSLGSLVALIPAMTYSAVMLWRTNWEDEFLKGKLEGYSRYTGKVRYRLIPGVW